MDSRLRGNDSFFHSWSGIEVLMDSRAGMTVFFLSLRGNDSFFHSWSGIEVLMDSRAGMTVFFILVT
jgi:hypothetical protein